MPNVKPTALTTNFSPDAGELSLADGFALFPWLGILRGPVLLDDEMGTLFDKTIDLELIRIELASTWLAFMGVAGPGIAWEFETEAETEYEIPEPGQPASGKLVLGDHAVRAGFQAGIEFGISLECGITVDYIFGKKHLLDFDAGIDIDVIQLIYELIQKILAGGAGGQGDSAEGDAGDYELSTFSTNQDDDGEPDVEEGEPSGEAPGKEKSKTVSPRFTGSGMVQFTPEPFTPIGSGVKTDVPNSLVEPNLGIAFSLVPLFADIPFLDILYGLDESLEAIGGGFEFGPKLNVGLPTDVRLTGVTLGNHVFDITEYERQSGTEPVGEFTLEERTPLDPQLQPLGTSVDEIGVLLEHEVGIEVGLSFFIELSFFKVANIGAETGILPLFYASLPAGAGGPFENHLSFIPGGGPVPFDPPDTAPTVVRYTANQPQGRWQGGVLARYAVSYYSNDYESPLSPFTPFDPEKRFYALAELGNVPTPPLVADDAPIGRRIYREFQGGQPEMVGEIADTTTTTFTDTTT